MKARIAGLIFLAILATGSLFLSSFWTRRMIETNKLVRDQADYRAWYWLIASCVFGAAWIWLLVKTIRYRAEDYQ
ncbi:hypothetical protein BH09PLA1_BH09PLA1_08160 [soil metagenome]